MPQILIRGDFPGRNHLVRSWVATFADSGVDTRAEQSFGPGGRQPVKGKNSMAEPCNVAFGRYLKTLRKRRSLSLEAVESLSNTFPEPIGKTYLSRCENGKQKVAFAKMIPLSRIYEVDPEVLVERMELDLELDRIGGPDTEGLSFEELFKRGKSNGERGLYWKAYGFLREALKDARTADLLHGMKTPDEQLLLTIMAYTIVAARLGGSQLALYELEHVKRSGELSKDKLPRLYILLSHRIQDQGHLTRAISWTRLLSLRVRRGPLRGAASRIRRCRQSPCHLPHS